MMGWTRRVSNSLKNIAKKLPRDYMLKADQAARLPASPPAQSFRQPPEDLHVVQGLLVGLVSGEDDVLAGCLAMPSLPTKNLPTKIA